MMPGDDLHEKLVAMQDEFERLIEVGNHEGAIESVARLCELYYIAHQNADVAARLPNDWAQQAVPLGREHGSQLVLARSLFVLGRHLAEVDNNAESIEALIDSLTVGGGNAPIEGYDPLPALEQLAELDRDLAIQAWVPIVTHARQHGNRWALVALLDNLGDQYRDAKRFDDACNAYRDAIREGAHANAGWSKAVTLELLAEAEGMLNLVGEAAAHREESSRLRRDCWDLAIRTKFRDSYGCLLMERQRARRRCAAAQDHRALYYALVYSAECCGACGCHDCIDSAVKLYRESLDICAPEWGRRVFGPNEILLTYSGLARAAAQRVFVYGEYPEKSFRQVWEALKGVCGRLTREWCTNLERLALIACDAQYHNLAHEANVSALAERRERTQNDKTADSRRDLCSTLDIMAYCDFCCGGGYARELLDESVLIRRNLVEQDQDATPETRRELSMTLELAGRVYFLDNKDPARALELYRESLNHRQQLVEQVNSPESYRDLSITLSDIALIEYATGDVTSALQSYERSIAIRIRLATGAGLNWRLHDPKQRLDAIEHVKQNMLEHPWLRCERLAELDDERKSVEESLLRRNGLRNLAGGEYREERWQALYDELQLLALRPDFHESLGQLGRLIRAIRQLGRSMDRRDRERLGEACQLGDQHRALDRFGCDYIARDCALVEFRDALIAARDVGEHADVPQHAGDGFANELIAEADVQRARLDLDFALATHERVLTIRRRCLDAHQTPEGLQDLVAALERAAAIEHERGDRDAEMEKRNELQERHRMRAEWDGQQ